jgi:hypothetical protein
VKRRLEFFAALAAVALATSVAGHSVFAAFSRTTSSSANAFATGTVNIGDNDGASAMLSLTAAAPGASDTGCIKVTYTGSLAAEVHLYASVSGGLASYLDLTVTRGTDSSPAFDSCAGFAADSTDYVGAGAGVIYSGTLASYPASYASGIIDASASAPATWNTNDAHSYKFVITLQNNSAAQGLSATATFDWEARNQ